MFITQANRDLGLFGDPAFGLKPQDERCFAVGLHNGLGWNARIGVRGAGRSRASGLDLGAGDQAAAKVGDGG